MIGTLKPSGPSSGSPIIGSDKPVYVEPIVEKTPGKGAKGTEPNVPQTQPDVPRTQPDVPRTQPDVPQTQPDVPRTQPAAQQIRNEAAPTVVQEAAPQAQEPIVITPRSVRAGNRSSGRSSSNLPGYTGGNGNGPLIYNP
jgi:hypothetical protein